MQKLTMRAKLPFVLLPVLILCLSLGSAYRAYAHADDEAVKLTIPPSINQV
jgi:hypothetical protein